MGHHDVLAAAAEGVTCILTEHTNTERGFLPRMGDQVIKGLGFRVQEHTHTHTNTERGFLPRTD
jgi:putative NIF3 family GTP cyclohydrolase 1 type 2